MTNECPICLDIMDKNLITTECNHTFHKECFDIWCSYKNSCPLCRLSFYKTYNCFGDKFGFKYKIQINPDCVKVYNFFYKKKYYYNKIQKIGFNNIFFYIYYLKNDKIKIVKYIFNSRDECEHFFKLVKNKITS